MIRIFPYSAIPFMEFEHYKTLTTAKPGFSGHVYRLITGSTADVTAVICTYLLATVKVPSRALPTGPREAGVSAEAWRDGLAPTSGVRRQQPTHLPVLHACWEKEKEKKNYLPWCCTDNILYI